MLRRIDSCAYVISLCSQPNFAGQITGAGLRYNLECAPCRTDFLFRRCAERVGVNGELGGQLAIAENLDAIGLAADEAVRTKQIGSHGLTSRKNIEFVQIENRVGDAKWIVKSALGHAAMQRHLAALKTSAARIAAAGFLTLVAGASGFAGLRAHAAADANFLEARALRRMQVRQAVRTA